MAGWEDIQGVFRLRVSPTCYWQVEEHLGNFYLYLVTELPDLDFKEVKVISCYDTLGDAMAAAERIEAEIGR